MDEKPIASEPKKPEPGVIYPRCPHCRTYFNSPGVLDPGPREDGTRPGDPLLHLYRLRHDFPDGVVAELLFCGDCRAVLGTQIVGIVPVGRKPVDPPSEKP